jgi:hypothetical protein
MVLYSQAFVNVRKKYDRAVEFVQVGCLRSSYVNFLAKSFPRACQRCKKKYTLRAPVMGLSPRVSLVHQVHVTYKTGSTRQKGQRKQWET